MNKDLVTALLAQPTQSTQVAIYFLSYPLVCGTAGRHSSNADNSGTAASAKAHPLYNCHAE